MVAALTIDRPVTLEEIVEKEKSEKDPLVRIRIQALRLVFLGKHKRYEIAEIVGVRFLAISRWVKRFNEEGFEGLRDKPGRGRKFKLNPQQLAQFDSWLQAGPDRKIDGVSNWSAPSLRAKILKELGVQVSEGAVYRMLKHLGYKHRKSRKIPAKANSEELAAFKKKLEKERSEALEQGRTVSIYWQDEALFSPSTDTGYCWFRAGQRPEKKVRIARDYLHLMGAVDAETGDLFGLFMPWLNSHTFQLFLDEFAKHLDQFYDREEDEVWLVLDRAGWHVSGELKEPEGMRLIVMPTGAAQINPIEQLWLYIRDHHTRNVEWSSYEDLEEELIRAFHKLWNEPAILQSVCGAGIYDSDLVINL